MKRGRWTFFLLLLVTPGFWYLVFRINTLFLQWFAIKTYVPFKVKSIFEIYNLRFVWDLRSHSLVSPYFYNKVSLLLNNLSEVLSLMSPKTYFVDSMVFGSWEMIPFFLFPLWFVGVWRLIEQRSVNVFIFLVIFSFVAYLVGQRSVYFLFPSALVNLYIVNEGLDKALIYARKKL